ncbi:MAG: NAD-dependent epimerase/dehydratase family protein [Dehalococcoidales bacterium]|nr:NAD-dependent epimerase/dehydratase family protein [Dehalococcoidales bacterium]
MTVVITGASGHIGANLVRALIDKGRPTRCLVHVNCEAIEGLDTEIVRGDIRDPDSLCRAFDGADIVYHLAACISLSMNDWPVMESVNVLGTRNVVEACLRTGIRRLVHFSSIHAMVQEPMSVPVDESRPPAESRRYPPYDRSKAAAETEVRWGIEKGLDAVIINPTAIIGPHDYQPSHFGEALLSLAQRRLPVLVTGGFDWVDVRDVVAGAMQAEEMAPAGAKYLLSGHWVSMRDIAAMVAEITGVPATRFIVPLWLAHIGAPFIQAVSHLNRKRPLYTGVSLRALRSNRRISHDRASRELGYRPRPFRETLTDTLRWFEENGQFTRPVSVKTGESG